MNRTRLLTLALPLLITACASPIVHNTPSGKAEVTINGVTRSQVSEYIAERMATHCADLIETSETRIVCEGPIQDELVRAMLSSRYDNNPIGRLTLNILKVKGGVRVVSNCAFISNPHSAFERKRECNNYQPSLTLQKSLDNTKRDLEGKRR